MSSGFDDARCARGRLRVHGHRVDADDAPEPRRHLRLRLHDDGVHPTVAPVAPGHARHAHDLDVGRRVVDGVDGVLHPGRRAELRPDAQRIGLVGKLVGSSECSGVGARLELALDEHRVADIDDKADADDEHDHRERRDDHYLPALVRRARRSTFGEASAERGILHNRIVGTNLRAAIPRAAHSIEG